MPTALPDRIALRVSASERLYLDPDDIYFIDADAGDTWIRLRNKRRIRDLRELGALERALAPFAFPACLLPARQAVARRDT
jgi:hypothetical protein